MLQNKAYSLKKIRRLFKIKKKLEVHEENPSVKKRNSESVSHSVMSNSATPWAVAHQASLSMGILQVRILEWVAIPFSRGSSQPRD